MSFDPAAVLIDRLVTDLTVDRAARVGHHPPAVSVQHNVEADGGHAARARSLTVRRYAQRMERIEKRAMTFIATFTLEKEGEPPLMLSAGLTGEAWGE
eukprot:4796924-Pyramimonas_sp.AAC.1